MAVLKREQWLAIGVGVVLGLFALDTYVVTPLLDSTAALEKERMTVLSEIDRSKKMLTERKRAAPRWKSMLATGLKDDPAKAESQVLHALRDWAKETGMTLTSVKPERPESKEQMKEILVQASATGTMDGIAKFMWKAQSAAFPIKLTEFQIASRTDGSDDLTLQIKASTLYMMGEAKVAEGGTGDSN